VAELVEVAQMAREKNRIRVRETVDAILGRIEWSRFKEYIII
jgi:hypothetical protein